MNKPRVGILTFHNTTNYGATLQAYALQKAIEGMGVYVEIIDYRPIKASLVYFRALFLNSEPHIGLKKYQLFNSFRKGRFNLSGKSRRQHNELVRSLSEYTHIFCGSDEIWNVNSFRGYDSAFFLDGLSDENVKKISYAASMGQSISFGDARKSIEQSLAKFNEVSVRDLNTNMRLESECGTVSSIVLDPTFLIAFDDVFPLQEKPLDGDYLLIYGVLDEIEQRYLRSVARSLGLMIVSVGYKNEVADINHVSVSVEEWVRYFKHASLIATIFYHGVIFSLKSDREVYVFTRASKNIKISSLSDLLNIDVTVPTMTDDTVSIDNVLSYKRGGCFDTTFDQAFNKSIEFIYRAIND